MPDSNKKLSKAQLEKLASDYAKLDFTEKRVRSKKKLTPAQRKYLAKRSLHLFSLANKKGRISSLYKNNKLQAVTFYCSGESMMPGVKSPLLFTYAAPTALKWLASDLAQIKLVKNTSVFLNQCDRAQIPIFQKIGFYVDGVILKGVPKIALTGLMKKFKPPADLEHVGLSIRKMKPKDIEPVVQIFRREFTRNPQFGWFCGLPGYLKWRRKDFAKQLKNKMSHKLVVCDKKNKVVGYFGTDAGKDPMVGIRGGTEIILDKSIQGKGVVKVAYRLMLEWMITKKVDVFQGGTAQPAVMGLAKVMKRWPSVYILLNGKAYFDKKHFIGL